MTPPPVETGDPPRSIGTPPTLERGTYTETTTKITTETILPPLSPPSCQATEKNPDKEEEKEEEKKAKQMIDSWIKQVHSRLSSGGVLPLTPKRLKSLITVLETVFGNNLDSWQKYCRQIAQCRYLMGGGFKVTLDWALKPDNAYKVLEGIFYDKPSDKPPVTRDYSPAKSWEEFFKELQDSYPEGIYKDAWCCISQHLAKKLGQAIYKSWFSGIRLMDVSSDRAVLQVDNSFIREYILSHYQQALEAAIRSVYPSVNSLHIQVALEKEATP